jgi:hypothetical protein
MPRHAAPASVPPTTAITAALYHVCGMARVLAHPCTGPFFDPLAFFSSLLHCLSPFSLLCTLLLRCARPIPPESLAVLSPVGVRPVSRTHQEVRLESLTL